MKNSITINCNDIRFFKKIFKKLKKFVDKLNELNILNKKDKERNFMFKRINNNVNETLNAQTVGFFSLL